MSDDAAVHTDARGARLATLDAGVLMLHGADGAVAATVADVDRGLLIYDAQERLLLSLELVFDALPMSDSEGRQFATLEDAAFAPVRGETAFVDARGAPLTYDSGDVQPLERASIGGLDVQLWTRRQHPLLVYARGAGARRPLVYAQNRLGASWRSQAERVSVGVRDGDARRAELVVSGLVGARAWGRLTEPPSMHLELRDGAGHEVFALEAHLPLLATAWSAAGADGAGARG